MADLPDDRVTHTPGPWYVASKRGKHELRISSGHWDSFATVVSRMENAKTDCADGLANARLITAAPDLLASLRELVAWQAAEKHAVPLIFLERARAAIKKAEGLT